MSGGSLFQTVIHSSPNQSHIRKENAQSRREKTITRMPFGIITRVPTEMHYYDPLIVAPNMMMARHHVIRRPQVLHVDREIVKEQ